MSDISRAIIAKQAEINQLQTDIEALQRAASIVGGEQPTTARRRPRRKVSAATRQALSKKLKAYWAKKATAARPKRRKMSAAAKKAVSKRMKAYWAKKKKTKR